MFIPVDNILKRINPVILGQYILPFHFLSGNRAVASHTDHLKQVSLQKIGGEKRQLPQGNRVALRNFQSL